MNTLNAVFKFLFWLSVFYLAYHLFLYGLLIWVLNKLLGRKDIEPVELEHYPSITVICPAYNEERDIEAKIKSFLALDYPKDKIRMLVVSDDSTDRTNEIVRNYTGQRIDLIVQKPRRGKQAAHNLVLPQIDSDLVLSTDATAIFESGSVKLLAGVLMSDPAIGMVSGMVKPEKKGEKQSGEGLYIQYESFLKDLDSRFYSVLVSIGAIYLIRRDLFAEVEENSADDFERTLHVLDKGYKVKFVKDAIVIEDETEFATEELSRKVRIITQEWYCVQRNPGLLNPFKHFRVSWMLFSHKVMRWLFFVPVILIWASTAYLSFTNWFWRILNIVLTFFLVMGALELIAQKHKKHIPLMGLPAYFVAMLIASLQAFINFLTGKNYKLWSTARD
ncbi:MAG TPA: glycosyltransferase family 2 protein [Candidatus Cloacimonadota bacterium]|jgi:cellulose synthase/poly-beta-1,6-N-acetylglucosamine synthase-like glycosyltransferase|nr:glycosyltransferase family 2 protein [Candidatus Cloacimonadota bacterium]HOF59425.1 glycosyltransferase family 2 protein [Candidatus Cloacimonadota bacterium]HOR58575.1 glycosyltransferase family 2 protein [Candidatus Cloacimonadota bacterium]HPB08976.1 glycosyltransferase family 2 protein [Candidatus Cloacimonadota bacterium]HQL12736.1 glycosyltransferase family 2 protein [Candidatus Cloacimonadota bacterium]